MKEFIIAALPWIVIGLCVAVLAANGIMQKKTSGGDEAAQGSYISEGMSIGMCMGVAFNGLLDIGLGLGISLGMLVGMIVGMMLKKKSE